jgi:hypothetical protein
MAGKAPHHQPVTIRPVSGQGAPPGRARAMWRLAGFRFSHVAGGRCIAQPVQSGDQAACRCLTAIARPGGHGGAVPGCACWPVLSRAGWLMRIRHVPSQSYLVFYPQHPWQTSARDGRCGLGSSPVSAAHRLCPSRHQELAQSGTRPASVLRCLFRIAGRVTVASWQAKYRMIMPWPGAQRDTGSFCRYVWDGCLPGASACCPVSDGHMVSTQTACR